MVKHITIYLTRDINIKHMKQSVERIKDDDIDLIMLPLPLFYATYKVNMLFSKGVTHICKMSG